MQFNLSFNIPVKCNRYTRANKELLEKDIDIKLNINKEQASNIIFRFSPSIFNLGKYNAVIKVDEMNKLKMVLLDNEKDIYIVNNINEVMADVVEGYIRIRTTEKINNIMEFDFETSLEDSEGIVDEFDLE